MEMKKQDGIELIDRIASHKNIWAAYKKVKSNGGAPGVDGITVDQLKSHLLKHEEPLT